MARLIQLQHGRFGRRIALVEDTSCTLIEQFQSIYALAQDVLAKGASLGDEIKRHVSGESIDYDAIYNGSSDWRLLPAFDRPEEPARRPGDAHVHYYGADAFSFGEGISLQDGDLMVVAWEGYGRPLINPIQIIDEEARFIAVKEM